MAGNNKSKKTPFVDAFKHIKQESSSPFAHLLLPFSPLVWIAVFYPLPSSADLPKRGNPVFSRRKNLPILRRFSFRFPARPSAPACSCCCGDGDVEMPNPPAGARLPPPADPPPAPPDAPDMLPPVDPSPGLPKRSTPSRAALMMAEPNVAGSNRPPDRFGAPIDPDAVRDPMPTEECPDAVVIWSGVRNGEF